MEDCTHLIQCHLFSGYFDRGRKTCCCCQLSLLLALRYSFKCQTYLLRQDYSKETTPPLTNKESCLNLYFSNNGITV